MHIVVQGARCDVCCPTTRLVGLCVAIVLLWLCVDRVHTDQCRHARRPQGMYRSSGEVGRRCTHGGQRECVERNGTVHTGVCNMLSLIVWMVLC